MITIGCKSLATLCKDYEFVVNDKNKLAELIAMLVMGWSRHGSSPPPTPPPSAIATHTSKPCHSWQA